MVRHFEGLYLYLRDDPTGDAAAVLPPPAHRAASQPTHSRSSRTAGQAGRCEPGLEQRTLIPSAVGRQSEEDSHKLPGEKSQKPNH